MKAESQGAQKVKAGVKFYTLIGILLVIIAIGVYAWSLQLQIGLIETNMRDIISWGLYISLFAWFVGVSAGGLIVSSSAAVFNITGWKPISKLANLVAAVAIALAAFSILPDLGRPDRLLNLFVYPNLSSPLIWDVTIIFTYLIISVVELTLLIRTDVARKRGAEESSLRRNERVVRVIAFVALPVAVLTHSITAWIFGLQISRPLWNTALLAPLFLASALVSGLGLVIFVAIFGNRYGIIQVSKEALAGLGRLLGVIILVDLFLLATEYITIIWPGTPAQVSPILVEYFGPYGWLAWVQWGLAITAFALVAVPRLRNSSLALIIASIFVLVEVFFYRLELVIPGFVNPLVQYPLGTSIGTYSVGTSSFALAGSYLPTAIEWSIAAGILAGAALLIALGMRFLPIASPSSSEVKSQQPEGLTPVGPAGIRATTSQEEK